MKWPFSKRTPDHEPMLMGERFFAEHHPHCSEPWPIYHLRSVAANALDGHIFSCLTRDDAETLIKALDRITEEPQEAAEPCSQPPQI